MERFSRKIVCGECGKFYKRKLERNKIKWVCQGYDNGTTNCTRNVADEYSMSDFVSRRLPVWDRTEDKVNEFIQNKVDKIIIRNKNDFTVHIIGQESMFIKEGHIHY